MFFALEIICICLHLEYCYSILFEMNVPVKMLLTAVAVALGAAAVYLFVTNVNTTAFIFRESGVSKVYFADHISPAHTAVIELFNRTHAGRIEVIPVDLNFSKFSTNERKELLARSLRSKSDRLDVFSVDYIWTPRFAKWCVDLNPYVPAAAQRNIIPPAIRSCVYTDRLVAMPLYIDIGVMYYRTDVIGRLPNAAEIDRKLTVSRSAGTN
jgi:ABC-type glycerol-3-phosphate transport system substrate-binding protein